MSAKFCNTYNALKSFLNKYLHIEENKTNLDMEIFHEEGDVPCSPIFSTHTSAVPMLQVYFCFHKTYIIGNLGKLF